MITNVSTGQIVYYWKDGEIVEGRVVGVRWAGALVNVVPVTDNMEWYGEKGLDNDQIYATRSEAEKAIASLGLKRVVLISRMDNKEAVWVGSKGLPVRVCIHGIDGDNIRVASGPERIQGAICGCIWWCNIDDIYLTEEECQKAADDKQEIPKFKVGDRVSVVAEGETVSGTIIVLMDNANIAYIQFDMPIRSEHNPAVIKWRWGYPLRYLTLEKVKEAEKAEEPKEKRRVWTCFNCAKDLFWEKYGYFHAYNSCSWCDPSAPLKQNNIAVPVPDSERWG